MYKKYKPVVSSVTSGKTLSFQRFSKTRLFSPVEDISKDILPTPHGTCDHVRYNSDIFLLMNQQRLDRLSLQSLTEYFNSLPVGNSSLSALRSKVSDSQLMQFIKSRSIQSASELMGWSYYITSEADRLNIQYDQYIQDLQKQDVDPSDPASGGDSKATD